jgi:hypothetical protein
MAYEDYRFVGIGRNQGVVFVTVDQLAYRIASFPAEAIACV